MLILGKGVNVGFRIGKSNSNKNVTTQTVPTELDKLSSYNRKAVKTSLEIDYIFS